MGKMTPVWAAALALVLAHGAAAQQVLQNAFEGRETIWVAGAHDAAYEETLHRLTDESAHNGQRSETIHLVAQAGSFIHYTYDVGRAPVNEDLNVLLFLRANRPGTQLLCRVVLPQERDPQNPQEFLTVLVPAETYQLVNRWQPLTLREPVKRLREQVQLLRAKLKRNVVADDAFVDRLVLNVYSGPGETKVWTDDLEIGPVFETKAPAAPGAGGPGRPAATRQTSEVQLNGNQLLVSGQRFFLLGIRHTGTPLKVLRDAGFNTVWLDETTPPGLIEDAVNLGFWVVPALSTPNRPGGRTPAQLTSREAFGRTVSRFIDTGAILGWDLGGNLTYEQTPDVARAAAAFRDVDPQRPVVADVADGFRSYSVSDFSDRLMMGTHRWPLGTSLELPAYKDWLARQRRLVPPKTFCWTWVQTHLPDWFLTTAYERGAGGKFDEPIGPQPEQIRILSYLAAGCGYRGLGYWSDRFLADSHTGRDRLLELALLNQEFQMLEPLLVGAKEPEWIDTNQGDIKAAMMRTDKAVLVLVVWVGGGGQYVPGKGAPWGLSVTVPQVPANCQAWEVLPGRLRSYKTDRVLGGTQVTLRDFNLTTVLVFTPDLGPTGLVVRFQEQHRRMRKAAAQWSHDLAEEELAKALHVQAELARAGQVLPDGEALAAKAREWLDRCKAQRRNGEFSEAYTSAQVALQAVRFLMRSHWEQATRGLSTPVSSPYAVSVFTLPRHYQFVEEVRRQRLEANALPEGDFEVPPDREMAGWLEQKVPPLDDVQMTAERVAEFPHAGKQCLRLQVSPRLPQLAPQVLERTFVAIHSPAVRLPPGTLVKVSGWLRIPKAITGSADGALLYDSAGGEPLAVRQTAATGIEWKNFTLYRRVPASGAIYVTMALTGLGTVFFDDVKIEPLAPRGQAAATPANPTESGLP
jgi:hypothetical protein